MERDRATVLAIVVMFAGLLAMAILADVLVTVFFALTVATVLVPVHRRLRAYLPRWWAATITTIAVFAGVIAILSPIAAVLYVRRFRVVAVLDVLPESISFTLAGFAYMLDTGPVQAAGTRWITAVAISLARSAPVIAVKALLFGIIVFALLLAGRQLRRSLLVPIPIAYHDIADALNRRVRDTLFALYIVQALTAVGTFLVALPVFVALGYGSPVLLAVIAGVLQFVPVVGPSLLVAVLAVYEVSIGAVSTAIVVFGVGVVLIGILPDAVIRPRLARRTARLPASLYFVGFTGGLLTIGPVGIIAGPLVVAVLLEAISLLAADMEAKSVGVRP